MILRLYLESGPRKQKTMVHVLDLLGCIATGPTTDAALAATPAATRAFLHFLRAHDEPIDVGAEFTFEVAEHITEGSWLGNGSTDITFQPDLAPLLVEDAQAYTRRLKWLRAATIAAVEILGAARMDARPEKGRSAREILMHVLESNQHYMRSTLGKTPEVDAVINAVQKGNEELIGGLGRAGRAEIERIAIMTEDERTRVMQRGKERWTAPKMLRRMLEHEWEHLLELRARLRDVVLADGN